MINKNYFFAGLATAMTLTFSYLIFRKFFNAGNKLNDSDYSDDDKLDKGLLNIGSSKSLRHRDKRTKNS